MRIAVVCPARPITRLSADRAAALAAILCPEAELAFHPQCFEDEASHLAGPDEARAAAFVQVADDPAVDAVWFGRGGYGSNRILASVVPALGPAAARKAYLGYSDMGFVLGALYARRIGRPAHGPMVVDIGRPGGDAAAARSLLWLARRDRAGLEPDLGDRPAAAFNLSILTALVGTPWLPDLADHILLIEEVGEPLYRVDRMLFQLAHATQLRGLAGVRLGAVTDVIPNDPPWAEPLDHMIRRWCAEMGVPYLGRAEVGHTATNTVVPFGVA